MSITEKTRKADEKLREKLKHVDPAELKKVINVLIAGKPKSKRKH